MFRFLFGSPFTGPRAICGAALVALLLGAGHSADWVIAFLAAIPAGCALAVIVVRSLR